MVQLRYSGSSSNQFAISSIGGGISDTVIPNNQLENLLDNVSRVEVINGRTEYKMFYVFNNDSDKYLKVRFKDIMIPDNTEIAFAVDNSVLPQLLVTEDSAPSGLTFFRFKDWDKLEMGIGALGLGKYKAIWIRRKVLIGSSEVRTVSITIDGKDDDFLQAPTEDFNSIQNGFDNESIVPHSASFYTDLDFVGEALTS